MSEYKKENFQLTITAENVISTDPRFTMNDLTLGDHYQILDTYFQNAEKQIIRRKYGKRESENTNRTMPKLACQIFEKEILMISKEEKMEFPICQYTPDTNFIRGIFPSIEAFKKRKPTVGSLTYQCTNGEKFVFYCINLFSTIYFVKDCLQRFGKLGDQFVLVYQEKNAKTDSNQKVTPFKGYLNPYATQLVESKNIIFHGAPGTGKSYLAKEIAADIVSNGQTKNYTALTATQKQQIEFVQFHPSYDYSDFVEGLRPYTNDSGVVGFKRQDGIFKAFVEKARVNFNNSKKTKSEIEKEAFAEKRISDFLSGIELGVQSFRTTSGTEFQIENMDEQHLYLSIPQNKVTNRLSLNLQELKAMLTSGQDFAQVKDVKEFFRKDHATMEFSYDLVLFKEIQQQHNVIFKPNLESEQLKKYVFIIDEINRGEISKIFGELFFSIDPGYRGSLGAVATQYANLQEDPEEKFYIPDNVYVIGTMNDIDRSVDSFDFAMRRRFRFIEIKASEHLEMLDSLGNLKKEAIQKMTALNSAITKVEELNDNYQIGASYFLKLKTLDFDQLWTDYLCPLLQEYVRGLYEEDQIMANFAQAYGYPTSRSEVTDDNL